MYCIKINIIFFISITIFSCFVKIKNSEKNNVNFINYGKKFKRNVGFQDNQTKLDDNSNIFNDENNKLLINNFNNEKNYRKKRAALSWMLKKWKLPIPYFIDARINHQFVTLALSIIQKETCVSFIKYSTMIPGLSGLRYFYGPDCSSPIGKQTDKAWQIINIGKGCDTVDTIQHETMHALGFFHEHARHDRDKYLILNKENINPSFHYDLRKISKMYSRTFGISFDFGSVMLYTARSYSKNEKMTIVPRDGNYTKTQGSSKSLSFNDAKQINMCYCQNKCKKRIKCMNGGYQDPNNCNSCKCIEGFGGRWCQFLPATLNECGKSVIIAKKMITLLKLNGQKNCIYHIFSKINEKVAIFIIVSSFYPNMRSLCDPRNSLEIKYWRDKAPTGAYFCLLDQKILIVGENNHVIVYFRSTNIKNRFIILLKSITENYNTNNLRDEFISEKIKLQNLKKTN
uniref:Metalloendopeptidase n=1 Tax=Strongyloides stercoralis TaxID=6248 RepID=A0A0K0EJK1_STRER